jgi:hypothetical protein
MNKICFSKIRDDVYFNMKILPITTIERLFTTSRRLTPDEVFIEIVKQSLLEFERYYPVKLTLKTPNVKCGVNDIGFNNNQVSWVNKYYQEDDQSIIKFYDNSEQVFYGLIPESDLELIPLAVKRLQHNFGVSHPTDYRNFEYQNPYLYGASVTSYAYFAGLFKWPVIEDKRNSEVRLIDKTWLLLMPYGNDTYRTLRSLVTRDCCDYILDLKNNFTLPGVPVEVFNGLSQIRERHDQLVQKEFNSAQVSWGWD